MSAAPQYKGVAGAATSIHSSLFLTPGTEGSEQHWLARVRPLQIPSAGSDWEEATADKCAAWP